MIGEVLALLRDQLNAWLRQQSGKASGHAAEDKVQMLDTSAKTDVVDFKVGKITLLLVNIEQEQVARPADAWHRRMPDGTTQRVQRDVRLNLYILFVARFTVYEQGLDLLGQVLRFFQSHPVIDRTDAPKLNPEIDKLAFELVTLPLAEQSSIWSQLRAAYQPSLMYRVRMVVFRDPGGAALPAVKEIETHAIQKT
jgi:hypothetical protein